MFVCVSSFVTSESQLVTLLNSSLTLKVLTGFPVVKLAAVVPGFCVVRSGLQPGTD